MEWKEMKWLDVSDIREDVECYLLKLNEILVHEGCLFSTLDADAAISKAVRTHIQRSLER